MRAKQRGRSQDCQPLLLVPTVTPDQCANGPPGLPDKHSLHPQQQRQWVAVARICPEVVRANQEVDHTRAVDPRQLAAVFDAPQQRAGLVTCSGTSGVVESPTTALGGPLYP